MTEFGQKVSEVEINPIKPRGGLVGYANCVYDEQLFLGNIAIMKSLGGDIWFSYPAKLVRNKDTGEVMVDRETKKPLKFFIFHPIKKEVKLLIEAAILKKIKDNNLFN